MKPTTLISLAVVAAMSLSVCAMADDGRGCHGCMKGWGGKHGVVGERFSGGWHRGGMKGRRGEMMQMRRQQFAEKLNLSDEQRAKIKELIQQIRKERQGSREEFHARFRAGLEKILTPEQKAKLERIRARRGEAAPAVQQKQPTPQQRQNFGPRRGGR